MQTNLLVSLVELQVVNYNYYSKTTGSLTFLHNQLGAINKGINDINHSFTVDTSMESVVDPTKMMQIILFLPTMDGEKIHLRTTLKFPECSNLFSFNVRALYPEEIWLVRNTDRRVVTEQSVRILSVWWTIRPCSLWRNMRSRKNDRAKQIS